MGPCFPNQHRVRALLSHLLINMSLKVSCKHKLVIFSSILTLLFHWKENKIQESDMKDGKERADLGYVLELKSIRIPRENEKRSQGLRERGGTFPS